MLLEHYGLAVKKGAFPQQKKNGQVATDARNNLQDALNSVWLNRKRVVSGMMHLK